MNYNFILIPLIAGLFAQTIKLLIKSNEKKFNLKNMAAYSGMPSGHSAMVASMTTTIGLYEGLESPIFALAFVFAFIVIRDALGLRQYLGQHGHFLNILVNDLAEDKMLDEQYPKMTEKIGHTPIQVTAGLLIGIGVSVLAYYIL